MLSEVSCGSGTARRGLQAQAAVERDAHDARRHGVLADGDELARYAPVEGDAGCEQVGGGGRGADQVVPPSVLIVSPAPPG